MQPGAAVDDALHRCHVALRQSRRQSLNLVERLAVLEQRHLDGFGQAAAPLAIAQRNQKCTVVDHRGWWRERAQEILLAERVDAVFDADARIRLGKHCGRNAYQANPTVSGRRGVAASGPAPV